jgi:hypothetical protein
VLSQKLTMPLRTIPTPISIKVRSEHAIALFVYLLRIMNQFNTFTIFLNPLILRAQNQGVQKNGEHTRCATFNLPSSPNLSQVGRRGARVAQSPSPALGEGFRVREFGKVAHGVSILN